MILVYCRPINKVDPLYSEEDRLFISQTCCTIYIIDSSLPQDDEGLCIRQRYKVLIELQEGITGSLGDSTDLQYNISPLNSWANRENDLDIKGFAKGMLVRLL